MPKYKNHFEFENEFANLIVTGLSPIEYSTVENGPGCK